MNGISINKLAKKIDVSADDLIKQLQEVGVSVASKEDLVSGEQQLRLLQRLRSLERVKQQKNVTLADINTATDLEDLNRLLTLAMADRTIQPLIKDEGLESVIDSVLDLVNIPEDELLAAAILGRLGAVARGRKSKVFERADQIFTKEPNTTIEILPDGDAKTYAATILAYLSDSWVSEYAYREALAIDSADNARRELLRANLKREDNIALWLQKITDHVSQYKETKNAETRLKWARRITAVMRDIVYTWRGHIGESVGDHLYNCLASFLILTGKDVDIDQATLYEVLDNLLAILERVIELRFSSALYPSTYAVIVNGKKRLGSGPWGRFISKSTVIPEIRIALLESALVLARQNRTDKQIMAVLTASYNSRPQVSAAIKRHFQDARDLDPDVADWWRSGGDVSGIQRRVEQKVGNTEDSQIGALLINVEDNHEAMSKVERAAVPLLEISDPVLSSTVKKAVDHYKSIEQIIRRLARMRKLTKKYSKGEQLEYNPLEHEMLGGHKAGVRLVLVVRDGIEKDFAGKKKTLVKPWVEPKE